MRNVGCSYNIHINSITVGWMRIFRGKGRKYVENLIRTSFCKVGSWKSGTNLKSNIKTNLREIAYVKRERVQLIHDGV